MYEVIKPFRGLVARHIPDMSRNAVIIQYACPDGVVHIMVHICDLVRKLDYPALESGRMSCRPVIAYAVTDLLRQVESRHILFKHIHDPQGLV